MRTTLWIIAAGMLVAAAVACGGSDSTGDAESPSPAADNGEAPAGETSSPEHEEGDSDGGDSGPHTFADYLSTGDCFNDQFDDEDEYDYSQPPIIVDCAGPHDNEVVLVTEYPAGPDEPFPDFETTDAYYDEVCVPAFEEFLGTPLDDSPLGSFYLSPFDEDEWATGSRSFACVLYLPDAQLEGTVRGAGAAVYPAHFPDDAPVVEGQVLSFVRTETDSSPGDNDWEIDPEGMVLVRFHHDGPTADIKAAFLASVAAAGWTVERQDGFASLGLETEFFDLRRDGRQIVVEVWELDDDTTSLNYFYLPEE